MASLLVVDDDPVVLSVTARILETVGHQVISAIGGALGVAIFELHEPRIQAVLMDLLMPEVDGLTAYHYIRCRRPAVPFVFVTGSGLHLPEAVRAEPAVAVLDKPFRMPELIAVVDNVLAAGPDRAWRAEDSWLLAAGTADPWQPARRLSPINHRPGR